MVSDRKLRNQRLREQSVRVDPKKIRWSGAITIVGGLALVIGTFLPFNDSSIEGLVTISRNAYKLGPQLSDNGLGVIYSILGVAIVALGVAILATYRGYWFDPLKHSMAGVVAGILIFNQMNADKASNLSGIDYSVGVGWYLCMAGAVLCFVAALIRMPSKATRLGLDATTLSP
jgi:hypothetical protein